MQPALFSFEDWPDISSWRISYHVALSKTGPNIFSAFVFPNPAIRSSTLVRRRPCCCPCCQPQWCCSDGPRWRNVSCLRHVRLCVVPCRCLLRGFASLWRSRNQPRAHLPGSQTRRRPEGTDWRHYCSLREAWLQTRWWVWEDDIDLWSVKTHTHTHTHTHTMITWRRQPKIVTIFICHRSHHYYDDKANDQFGLTLGCFNRLLLCWNDCCLTFTFLCVCHLFVFSIPQWIHHQYRSCLFFKLQRYDSIYLFAPSIQSSRKRSENGEFYECKFSSQPLMSSRSI